MNKKNKTQKALSIHRQDQIRYRRVKIVLQVSTHPLESRHARIVLLASTNQVLDNQLAQIVLPGT